MWRYDSPYSLMVKVDMGYCICIKQLPFYQISIIGAQCQILKVVITIFLSNKQHILNPDSKTPLSVIPWLVCNYHPIFKLDLAQSADTHWRFMNSCKVSNSMSCTMLIVPSFLPKVTTCEYIYLSPIERPFGPL